MELLLVRHALPVRVDNTATGEAADPVLSELGWRQSQALADWLAGALPGGPPAEPVDAVYASTRVRARQSSEPLTGRLGQDLRLEPGLDEYDYGEPEYIPIEELKATGDPRWHELASEDAIPAPEAFMAQVVGGVDRIIAAHSGQRVVAFCHGGTICAYMAHLLGLDRILFFEAAYTSVNRVLAASTGERSLGSLNETAHLRVAGLPTYSPDS
ncbi:MAG: histidine phosphatase family protein [Acidimicrobiales bacterium]|jgi:broad specificity phosphatase PhoE|nr:histidine phosphatase family protein [Acidimicrobiales bacterium]